MTEYLVSISQRFTDRAEAVVAAGKMVTSSSVSGDLTVSIFKMDDEDTDQ